MTRRFLSSLAIAAMLSLIANTVPAQTNYNPKELPLSWHKDAKPKTAQRPSSLTRPQRKQKYHELKLDKALVVPVSPSASKRRGDHKGEIEIYAISPSASPSTGPPRKAPASGQVARP